MMADMSMQTDLRGSRGVHQCRRWSGWGASEMEGLDWVPCREVPCINIKPQALSATFPTWFLRFWADSIKGVVCLGDNFLTHSDTQLSGCSYNLKEKCLCLHFMRYMCDLGYA